MFSRADRQIRHKGDGADTGLVFAEINMTPCYESLLVVYRKRWRFLPYEMLLICPRGKGH